MLAAAVGASALGAIFLNPLAHGLTHFSQRLPSYVQNEEHGRAGSAT